MAGAGGFEPTKAVLETAGLPLAYAPTFSGAFRQLTEPILVYHLKNSLASPVGLFRLPPEVYLISLCGKCLRQNGQNFLSSKRSVVVFLFFMLV